MQSPWEAIGNIDRDGVGEGSIVKAEWNLRDTMDTKVRAQDTTLAKTLTEIQELTAVKTMCNVHEMIADKMLSLTNQAPDHAFQFKNLSTESGIHTVLLEIIAQVFFELIRQDVLKKTLNKRISKYFEVKKAAVTFLSKLLVKLYTG